MKFDLTTPCGNCPFKREGHIPLRPDRAEEIADGQLRSNGPTFTCHKTATAGRSGMQVNGKNAAHCAGALIFQLKNDNMTQVVRVAHRLKLFDPERLMSNEAAVASVFDDESEMIEAYTDDERAEAKRLEHLP